MMMSEQVQENPDVNPMVKAVREYAAEAIGAEAIVISARIEEELMDLDPEEAKEFLAEMGIKDSGASTLIKGVYELLGLRTYLTTGEKETRAWTIEAGDKAPAALLRRHVIKVSFVLKVKITK